MNTEQKRMEIDEVSAISKATAHDLELLTTDELRKIALELISQLTDEEAARIWANVLEVRTNE